MSARGRDLVRAVHRELLLRGGRDAPLARSLEDALHELENGGRGGAYALRTDDSDELEVELARFVGTLDKVKRAALVDVLLDVDGMQLFDERAELRSKMAALLESRAWR